jgi:hypothetical protein
MSHDRQRASHLSTTILRPRGRIAREVKSPRRQVQYHSFREWHVDIRAPEPAGGDLVLTRPRRRYMPR